MKSNNTRDIVNQQPPAVITLVGSSKYIEHFAVMAWLLEKERGAIVLGLHYLPPYYAACTDHQAEAEGVAEHFDELHLRKIDISDSIFVLNVNGYIGESTLREIAYAIKQGKTIEWLNSPENLETLFEQDQSPAHQVSS